jgi:DNA adenine methylase/adenine-specific DNA-methyltransferase
MGDNKLSSQTLPRPFQTQLRLVEPPQPKNTASGVLRRASAYPEMRYMGSKHRLITWIHEILSSLDFESAWDPFSGSGCVAYLMKSMGKQVLASDFLNFPTVVAKATIENSRVNLDGPAVKTLLSRSRTASNFIESTYGGIFFTSNDLRFLDQVSANISALENPHHRAVAMAALLRSCLKKQPRGVFTVSGDLTSYDDGRRDKGAVNAAR